MPFMFALHVFQANLRKQCLIFHQRQQNTGPLRSFVAQWEDPFS